MAPQCSLDDVGRLVIPAQQSWTVQSDVPYFDPRLIVDTCAQYVAASFQFSSTVADSIVARFGRETQEMRPPSPRRPDAKKPAYKRPRKAILQMDAEAAKQAGTAKPKSIPKPKRPAYFQAMASHAHGYLGSDRLVLELVPRCIPLRDQVLETARPICFDAVEGCESNPVHDKQVQNEVNRFLRARLVKVDLSDLITYDCFQDVGDGMKTRRVSMKQHTMERMASVADDAERKWMSQRISNRRGALLDESEIRKFIQRESQPEEANTKYKEGFEFVVKRFELRFWRNFIAGLGAALFGSEQSDLISMFEENCDAIFTRYGGELQLSINSLMGGLPSWVSDSLFVAFVGLGAGVAARQPMEKFLMLHRCVKSLLHSSGRYILVCTPAWYLPMVNSQPLPGPSVHLKKKFGDGVLSFRPLWPAACLDPHKCTELVDEIWGGAKKGVCATLLLHGGIEPVGRWVLRMTLGCERLFAPCLEVMKKNWHILEAVYNENRQEFEKMIRDLGVREEGTTAHNKQLLEVSLSGEWYVVEKEALHAFMHRAVDNLVGFAKVWHRRKLLSRRTLVYTKRTENKGWDFLRKALAPGGALKSALKRKTNTTGSVVLKTTTSDTVASSERFSIQITDSATEPRKRTTKSAAAFDDNVEGDGLGPSSLLVKLRADTTGLAKFFADGPCRLRRVIRTGGGDDTIEWPIGQPGAFGGRIPIHDSPELSPAAPPPVIDTFELPPAADAGQSDGATSPRLTSQHPWSMGGDSPASSRGGQRSPALSRARSRGAVSESGKDRQAALSPLDLYRPMGRKKITRRDSMPDPSKPEDFMESLERFLKRTQNGFRDEILPPHARRTKSAPARVDTTEFDHGDPTKNTVVALALQRMMSQAIAPICDTDGPFATAWRQPQAGEDLQEIQRVQLSVGVLLLLAAWRAPLGAWTELPLRHFTSVGGQHKQKGNEMLQDVAKISVPDGIYIAGFTPIFQCMQAEGSSRVAPFVAQAFHVDVPHAFLEDHSIESALTQRVRMAGGLSVARRWREGSALALLMAAACRELHAVSPDLCEPNGWVRQDHRSVFPVMCAFRVVLGLEYVGIWQMEMQQAKDVTFEQFFPFVRGTEAKCRMLSVRLTMDADQGQRPLVVAPWVKPELPANEEAVSNEAWKPSQLYEGPDSEPVSLQSFAAWVTHMPHGRVVYSSWRSRIGDLYLRLPNAIVVFSFVQRGNKKPIRKQDVRQLFREAVGDLEWWGVSLVSFVVVCNHLSFDLEELTLPAGCHVFSEGARLDKEEDFVSRAAWAEARKDAAKRTAKHRTFVGAAGPVVATDMQNPRDPDRLVVPPGSEIIVCASQCLQSILGDLMEPICAQTTVHDKEIAKQAFAEEQWMNKYQDRRAMRTEVGRPQLRGAALGASLDMRLRQLAAGCAARVVKARAPRLQKPKPFQLDFNFQVLEQLMDHVSAQTKKLYSTIATIQDIEATRARDSMPSWLAEVEASEVTEDLLAVASSEKEAAQERKLPTKEIPRVKAPAFAMNFSWLDSLHEPANRSVRIARVPSPKQTEKRRAWRPWTPHSRKPIGEGTSAAKDAAVKPSLISMLQNVKEPTLPFDFLGVTGWKGLVQRAHIEKTELLAGPVKRRDSRLRVQV